jgi:hypothetical protein
MSSNNFLVVRKKKKLQIKKVKIDPPGKEVARERAKNQKKREMPTDRNLQ